MNKEVPTSTGDAIKDLDSEQAEQKETSLGFKEFIKSELDKPLTPQEAIEKLCEFHNASPEAVIKSFRNLRKYYEDENENEKDSDDVITFKEAATTSGDFEMYCNGKDGSFKWHVPINVFGNPEQIVG